MENIEDIYELSAMQQGILFHSLLTSEADVYFTLQVFSLVGPLNIVAFEKAWQRIIDRHPILRTSFFWDDLDKPLQVVHRQVKLPLERRDWREFLPDEQERRLEALIQEERSRGFVLSEPPLVRLILVRMAKETHRFFLSGHHVLLDGWSMSLLLKEVLVFYQAFCRGQDVQLDRCRPYGDYIEWLQRQDVSQAEAFWRQELKGFTTPTPLMVDRMPDNGSQQKKGYGSRQVQLSMGTTMGLRALGRQHQLTINTLVQGAWALLLSRYSGEEDVVFGATVSGRSIDLAGIESMVGLFINTLPVRVQVSRKAMLLPWLKELQTRQIEARQYEYAALTQIQGWSEVPRRLPMFESILVFENYPSDGISFSAWKQSVSLDLHTASGIDQTNYPLTLCVAERTDGLSASLLYNADLFEEATIIRALGHFQTLLEGMATDPEQSLAKLPLLTEAEQHQLLIEWNNTRTDYPQGLCIHRLFEAQVERTPDAIAVAFEEERLTYRELNRRANQLAHHLRSLGVGPEVLVGIYVERSLEMVVGLLGILKAGGGYVPLDPSYPDEHVAFMLEDAQVHVLLTQGRLVGRLPKNRAKIVCLDADLGLLAQESKENPIGEVAAENIAYVIYTSGSTGRPKGVAIEHRCSVALLHWARDIFAPEDLAGVLAATSICFDCSVFELFVPLSWGGKVILVESPLHLPSLPRANEVTLINTVPSTIAELLKIDGIPRSVRTVNLGGETPQSKLVEQLYQRNSVHQIFNVYGPTECTTYSTFSLIGRNVSPFPSIGHPIANTSIYILDGYGAPVPIGVPGELHIGGAGLARGYLNCPEPTAEKFIPNPFSDAPGARLYKTGDLARYLPDGNIEFLGRFDQQVKIRGFRIEMEEIETVLRQHPALQEALVVAREDKPGEKCLVAYVVADSESLPTSGELRGFLREKLPDFMVPAAFVRLEALPLLPNGKVDRRALPAPQEAQLALNSVFVAPRDTLELQLKQIWEDILETRPIGITDNFFDLGGHSLLAVRLMTQIQNRFAQDLPLSSLFQGATIEHLASILRRQTASLPWSSLVRIQPIGSKRPFFCVHPVGGNVLCYVDLARHLGLDQPFFGLQAPGLEGEREPHSRIEDMAAHYIEALRVVQPEGPYLLGGWSFGGVVAFEMAQQLQKQNHEVPLLVLIDSGVPTFDSSNAIIDDTKLLALLPIQLGYPLEKSLSVRYDDLHRLDFEEQLNYVLERARMANIMPPDAGLSQIRRLLKVYKANIQAMQSYIPQVYPSRITLFRASEGLAEDHQDPSLGWREFAAGGVEVYTLPGDHYTMVREPHVQVLAGRLAACLDEAVRSWTLAAI